MEGKSAEEGQLDGRSETRQVLVRAVIPAAAVLVLAVVRVPTPRRVVGEMRVFMAVVATQAVVRQSGGAALVVHLAVTHRTSDRLRLEGSDDHEKNKCDEAAKNHGSSNPRQRQTNFESKRFGPSDQVMGDPACTGHAPRAFLGA